MRKPKIVSIGEHKFGISRMDAFTALEVFGDLQKELLPALGSLIKPESEQDGTMNALTALSGSLSGKSLTKWANRLLDPDHISVENADGDLEKLTADRREMVFDNAVEILELMVAIIRENFADPLMQWLARSGLEAQLKDKIQSAASAKT
ncbi:hypothetical protein A7P96_05155 [Eikenella sp. NML03-A-027]|uniref:phage tail assembly chaperone n=1 Tax=Eikenella sp. NML03-A-027 TaxID=1795828 RepID=UPI0007E159C3|nr:hypothetical protein [Eikenella sp. NML03-A-027]OAM31674.1 hypothetical protein A7P96_05155 [Eikenella sp. NML03-A-027]